MAIAFNAGADLGNNSGSGSLTASYTVSTGSNRMLVVALAGDSSSDNITGLTYAGVAMSLACKKAPGNRWTYLYYLLGPSSGANNVVISTSGGYILAVAGDYTGVAQTSQPDATTTNAGSATSLTGTLTTIADQCWTIMGFGGYNGNSPPTAGSGSTRRTYDATFGTIGLFDSNAAITPAGSYSMTASYSGTTNENLAMASFSPAAGSPSATPHNLSSLGVGA